MALEDFQALIVPGRFLKLWCTFTRPPKEKYFLVVATAPWVIGFLINSELTAFQKTRPDLVNENIGISGGFLPHRSYLDCTCAIQDLEMAEICAQLGDQPKRLLSSAPQDLIERVKRVVDGSLLIEAGVRKIILRNLVAQYPAP
jgi:hypothetical protein